MSHPLPLPQLEEQLSPNARQRLRAKFHTSPRYLSPPQKAAWRADAEAELAAAAPAPDRATPAVQLFAAGVTQLVPIADGTKGPNHKSWPDNARSLSAAGAASITGGFGILGDINPSLDSDTPDPTITEIVAATADTLYASGEPGNRLTHRIGNKGFAVLFEREREAFGLVKMQLVAADGSRHGEIELRGYNLQTKYDGSAGNTSAHYVFEDATGRGGVEKLVASARRGLPRISRENFVGPFREALEQRLAADPRTSALGLRVEVIKDAAAKSQADAPISREALRAPTPETLAAAAPFVRNGADVDRDEWRDTLLAFKGSGGEEARDLAYAFHERGAEHWNNTPAEFDAVWQMEPRTLGWDYIRAKARAGGWDDTPLDFAALSGSTPPVEEPIVALGTREERLAALAGDAERVCDYAVRNVPDSELESWLDRIDRAAEQRDPLSSLFDQLLPLSIGEARSPRYCLREISARCRHSAWLALDQSERELLAEALFIHRARANDLAPRPSLQRMPLVRRVRTDDLLAGIIPRTGVVGVIAPSQSGKTWLLRDLGARTAADPRVDDMGLAQPEMLAGLPLAHGSVMYCTSEDHAGVADRFAQWIELDGRPLDNLVLLNDVPLLTSRRDTLAQLRRALLSRKPDAPPLRLVVIDVFQDAIEGSDNDNDVVGPAVRTGTLISRLFGCAVVIAHHTPLADKTRSRGATAFENSLDVSLILSMDAAQTITATVKKNRSGRTGAVYTFHLEDRRTANGSSAVALVDGPATAAPTEASTGRARAEAAAHCLADSFTEGEWVTAAALRKELETNHVFAAIEKVSRGKAKSRAVDDAVNAGWIAQRERSNKIEMRAVCRPPLAPGNVEELL